MTHSELMALTRQETQGFRLPCQAGELVVHATVRRVPDRRLVVRGLWQGQPVYAKIFLGSRHAYYAKRDHAGVTLLCKHEIATPRVLHHEIALGKEFSVIIFEQIQNAINGEQWYAAANDTERLSLSLRMMTLLATHHNHHIVQTDLYLKNFLVEPKQLWTLDGDGIRYVRNLSMRVRLRYLIMLLSKFDMLLVAQHLSVLLQAYTAHSAQKTTIALPTLAHAVQRYRSHVATGYAYHKVFRTCTDVVVQKNSSLLLACARSASENLWGLNAARLDTFLLQGKRLKSGQTCTVGLASIGPQSLVIKRYNIKHMWHGLLRAFRASRAASSWQNAHLLKCYSLATPAPLMLLEQRFFGLRRTAYYVSAYSPWPDALTFFKQTTDKRLRAEAMKQLATLCYQLYLLKLSHGDMKASNLQITDQGGVIVIDLDSMRQHRFACMAMRAHVRDLRRLLQNWQEDTSLYNALLKSLRVVYADPTPLQQAGLFV